MWKKISKKKSKNSVGRFSDFFQDLGQNRGFGNFEHKKPKNPGKILM
jgi:hypothetical protein